MDIIVSDFDWILRHFKSNIIDSICDSCKQNYSSKFKKGRHVNIKKDCNRLPSKTRPNIPSIAFRIGYKKSLILPVLLHLWIFSCFMWRTAYAVPVEDLHYGNQPFLISQPEDEVFIEGNRHTLTCTATGDQPLVFTWQKDGVDLGSTGSSLQLLSVSQSDKGIYRCLVSNKIGTIISKGARVDVAYIDDFQGSAQSASVREGNPIILTCPEIDSFPVPTYSWTQAGRSLTGSNKIVTLDGRLVILDTSLADASTYNCQAVNNKLGVSKVSAAITLNVQANSNSPIPPTLVIPPKNTAFTDSDTLIELECIVNARPLSQLSYSWMQNGEILPSETTSLLVIYNPSIIHQGVYACMASMTGQSSVEVMANLTFYTSPEFNLHAGRTVTGDVDTIVDLPCQPLGIPRPNITWYRNAVKVEDIGISRYQVLASGSLQIQDLEPSDAGMYQCEISNEVDEAIADTRLQVERIPPTMLLAPVDTTVVEMTQTLLHCLTTGAPAPNVAWMKGETLIINEDSVIEAGRFELKDNGDLLIFSSETTDSGLYTCIASNSVGSVNASANLLVQKRTYIEIRPVNTQVVLAEDTIMYCVISYDPSISLDISWYHEDVRVDFSDTRFVQLGDGSLRINSARQADKGQYQCNVTSSAGDDSAKAVLTILELPYAPMNLVAALSSTNTRTILLTWSPGFDGNSPLTRYIVEQKEDSNAFKTILTNVAPSTTSLQVTSVRPSHSYLYRVTPVNGVGAGTTSSESNLVSLPEEPPDDPPQGVVASPRSTSEISMEWQEPPMNTLNGELRGYAIRYRLQGYDQSYSMVNISTQTSYVLTDLITWTVYEIEIAGFNRAGIGTYSNPVVVRTLEGVPTQAPQEVVAYAVNSTAIKVEWKAPHPQTLNGINQGYKMEARSVNQEDEVTTVVVPVDTANDLQVGYLTTLKKYTRYDVSVRCFTTPGDGPASPAIRVTTDQDTPGPVGDLSFTDVYDTSLVVSWLRPTEPNGIIKTYKVEWEEVSNPFWNRNRQVNPPSNKAEITGLTAETLYEITVTAWTDVGEGEPSSATIKSGVPPEPPTAPMNLAISNVQARSVYIQFIQGYDGKTSIREWTTEAQIGFSQEWVVIYKYSDPESTGYTIPNLSPYTNYRFRIIATNIVNSSAPSEPSTLTQTQQDIPSVYPQGVVVRSYSETSLRVRWVPLLDEQWNGIALGYKILWREASDNTSAPSEYNLPDPYAREGFINDLQEWTAYTVKVLAYNKIGNGPESPSQTQRTSDTVPSAGPVDVGAVALNSSSILVSWGEVPPTEHNGLILGFKVLYQETSNAANFYIMDVPGYDNRFVQLNNLRGYTEYSIQVLAYTRIGDGTPSNAIVESTIEDVPGPPSNVLFPVVTINSVRVEWDPPLEPNGIILGYEVGYRLQSADDFEIVNMDVGMRKYYNKDNLTANQMYLFTVTAKTGLGLGTPAEVLVYTTNDRSVPEKPSKPIVNQALVESRAVPITWQADVDNRSPLRSYTIQVSSGSSSSAFTDHITNVSPLLTAYKVDNLLPYTNYRFRLQAINDVGPSAYSDSSSVVTTRQDIPEGQPIITNVVPYAPTAIRISWQPPPSDTLNGQLQGYRITFRKLPDGDFTERIVSDKSVTEYELTNLERYVEYEVKVDAYNSEGHGPYSVPETVFVGEAIPSAPPTNLVVVVVGSSALNISWIPPPSESQNGGLQGYKVHYWLPGRKNDTKLLRTIATTNNWLMLDGLTCFTEYVVAISGFNVAGDGPLSEEATGTTGPDVPGVVGELKFETVRMTTLNVTWEPPPKPCGQILGYEVFYQPKTTIAGEKATVTIRTKGTDNWLKVENLGERVMYMFTIKANTSSGFGEAVEANIRTGPQEGSPDSPTDLKLDSTDTSVTLTWKRPAYPGASPLLRYIIEYKEQDVEWELLSDSIDPDTTSYVISYGNLKSSTLYEFRLMAENSQSISEPAFADNPFAVPATGTVVFYEEWWFLVIVGLVGFIVVILVVATLCMCGKNGKYVDKKVHRNVLDESVTNMEDNSFTAFEMSNSRRPSGGRRSQHRGRGRGNSYSRAPPRPSPGNIHYSEEEESKHYEDVQRTVPPPPAFETPDDFSSVTEKPSEVDDESEDETQLTLSSRSFRNANSYCLIAQGSDSDIGSEVRVPDHHHTFINHYAKDPATTTWKRYHAGGAAAAYSYTDSEPDMAMANGSVILNGVTGMQPGSRQPLHGFSSFV
ncbi:protein sidekick-2-like isoform X2 [Anneissia japonica]|uniref:protein sidekick-2-like isoform X2 n=1 Tax=Anneissia japonica TaxID=1529436 RepID=UPI001425AE99|nr:protein sidekick-2-like isoform X2 [Anneissia japonica]